MPIHDWTKVSAGTFHHLHQAWITEQSKALNSGLLPKQYYALAEQRAGDVMPDVLALEFRKTPSPLPFPNDDSDKMIALLEAPPKVSITEDMEWYARKQNTLVIRHGSDDSIVAMIEIISHGNKSSRSHLDALLDKVEEALGNGINLLLIDLHPPGTFDPQGIHGAISTELGTESNGSKYRAPKGKPLTLAAYAAAPAAKAYVEPAAVGDKLIDMPLFLTPGHYINVPLEETYMAAYAGVPARWKRVIEG